MNPLALRTSAWCLGLIMSAVAAASLAAGPVTSVTSKIRKLETDWNAAYAANDLPRYFSYYAADPVLLFDDAHTSLADYRKSWTKSTRTDPVISVQVSDELIRVGPAADTAVASYKIDVQFRHADGKTSVEHALETDVWFQRNGVWRVEVAQYSTATSK